MLRKKTIKKLVSIFIVAILSQTSFSQENYLPGYVIKPAGDTLKGFIDYRDREETPHKIKFKEKLDNSSIEYKPMDIVEFGVQGEIFVSGAITIEISPVETGRLQEDPTLHFKVDTTFLQTLFKGGKSLYYFKDPDGKENFYIKQHAAFELLIYKKYLKNKGGTHVIAENKRYLGQLLTYLNDCQTIQTKIEGTGYQKRGMVNLFHSYYQCTNSTIGFQKKTEKITTEIGVLAGLSFISKYNNHSPTSPDVIGPSTNMSMGVSLNFVFPKNQKKWSIRNEFIYAPHNATRHTVEYEMANVYTITDQKSKYIMFKMNNMLRYQYPVKKAFVYFNFGASTGRGIQKITYQRIESVYHSIIKITEGSDVGKTPEIEIGLNYGLGVKYKRFSFEARVESTDGYFKLPKLFSDFSRHYLFLGYKL